MNYHNRSITVGPVFVSALSLIITFILIQPLACWLGHDFSLLSNRGIGKIAFMSMALIHLIGFAMLVPRSFFASFAVINLGFFRYRSWIADFLLFFTLFSLLHASFLGTVVLAGYAFWQSIAQELSTKLAGALAVGFVATFFLAWSEEMIFRGTVYTYLSRSMTGFSSIIITSAAFALVHNLSAPWMLLSTDYKLGIGLFLLGCLLNIIFVITNKLYCSMGAHAGLVFIKVCLRRIPFIAILPQSQLPWWLHTDMRQSFLVHGIFILCITVMCFYYRKIIFTPPCATLKGT